MKQMNRRFEIVYTQDAIFTSFHILLDKETQCHYLWISSEHGMALTALQSSATSVNLENQDKCVSSTGNNIF